MIVTISREYGASGMTVAHRVGDLLGYPVVGDDLPKIAALRLGTTHEDVVAMSTVPRRSRSASSTIWEAPKASPPLRRTSKARCAEKLRPRCSRPRSNPTSSIVGGIANVILRGRQNLLSVFLHAPRAFRISRVIESLKIERRGSAQGSRARRCGAHALGQTALRSRVGSCRVLLDDARRRTRRNRRRRVSDCKRGQPSLARNENLARTAHRRATHPRTQAPLVERVRVPRFSSALVRSGRRQCRLLDAIHVYDVSGRRRPRAQCCAERVQSWSRRRGAFDSGFCVLADCGLHCRSLSTPANAALSPIPVKRFLHSVWPSHRYTTSRGYSMSSI